MTTDARTATALRTYAIEPLCDGDAVFLLDGAVCLEVEGMADEWDEVLCANTANLLRETAHSVVVGIARRRADLREGDHLIWHGLHEALRDSAVALQPLEALPAA